MEGADQSSRNHYDLVHVRWLTTLVVIRDTLKKKRLTYGLAASMNTQRSKRTNANGWRLAQSCLLSETCGWLSRKKAELCERRWPDSGSNDSASAWLQAGDLGMTTAADATVSNHS
jgi:hypothetical protein